MDVGQGQGQVRAATVPPFTVLCPNSGQGHFKQLRAGWPLLRETGKQFEAKGQVKAGTFWGVDEDSTGHLSRFRGPLTLVLVLTPLCLSLLLSHSLTRSLNFSLCILFFSLVPFPLPPIPSSPAGQRQTRGKRMSDGLDERWPGLGAPLRNQQSWRTGIGLILVAQTARACQGKGGCSRGEGRGEGVRAVTQRRMPLASSSTVVRRTGMYTRVTHTPHTHAYVAHRHDTRDEEAGAPLSVCRPQYQNRATLTHTHHHHYQPPLPITANYTSKKEGKSRFWIFES